MGRRPPGSRAIAAAAALLWCACLQLSLSGCEAPYDSSTEDCVLGDDYSEVKPRTGSPYYRVEYSFNVDGRSYGGIGRLEAEPTTRECTAFYMARNPKNNALTSTVGWHLGRGINEAALRTTAVSIWGSRRPTWPPSSRNGPSPHRPSCLPTIPRRPKSAP
ncbi:MAG: hypothetical protein HY748_05055 [Elusimicrobia bacterium]|nr:hypothetical protein [Elusimicrobiota bacterium]